MNTPVGGGTGDTTPPTAPANLTATAVELDPGQPLLVGRDRQRRRSPATASSAARAPAAPTSPRSPPPAAPAPRTTTPAVSANDAPTAIASAPPTPPPTSAPTARPPPRPRRRAADTTPPTAPANLTATAVSPTQINLAWTAATDNVGGHRLPRRALPGCRLLQLRRDRRPQRHRHHLQRHGPSSPAPPTATASAPPTPPPTSAPTPRSPPRPRRRPPDTTPPTAPASLTATAVRPDADQPRLDRGDRQRRRHRLPRRALPGRRLHHLRRDRRPSGTGTTLQRHRPSSPTPPTATASAPPTPPPTSAPTRTPPPRPRPARPTRPPPTAPANLTATAVSAAQIDLAWTAATDNVGVTGYRVERCQGAGCSDLRRDRRHRAPGRRTTTPAVVADTSYRYRVRATDAASNLGPYSTIASATTPAALARRLVAAYSFDEGAGTTVADASGNGQHRDDRERDLDDAGQVRQALELQRHERPRDDARRRVAAPDERDDARGVGRPDHRLERLARRDLQGRRQLLPHGNRATRRPPGAGGIFSGSTAMRSGPSALPSTPGRTSPPPTTARPCACTSTASRSRARPRPARSPPRSNPLQIGGDAFYGQYFAGRDRRGPHLQQRADRRPDPIRHEHTRRRRRLIRGNPRLSQSFVIGCDRRCRVASSQNGQVPSSASG